MRRWVEIIGSVALAAALVLIPGTAAAGPDVDGAIEALIDTPMNTLGDVGGAVGLVASGLTGGVGDLVGLVDDNRYSHVVLRGFFSTTIQRLGLGISNTFTGMLEGMRAEDLQRYPEPAAAYLDSTEAMTRVDNVMDGIGGLYVGLTDLVGNPVLMALRAVGANSTADGVGRHMGRVRDRYFGEVAAP